MKLAMKLMRYDLLQTLRDPMLVMAFVAPILLLLLCRYGLPVAEEWLLDAMRFELNVYEDVVLSIVVLLIPQIIGMAGGFIMLDERDEQLIAYYAITPLGKLGHLQYRLALPIALSVVFSALLLTIAQFTPLQGWAAAGVLLQLAMQAVMMTLFLVVYASNKVEGLALAKIAGLTVLLPFIVYFVPAPWHVLGSFSPTYWPALLILLARGESLTAAVAVLGLGVLLHLAALLYLYRKYVNQFG